MTEWRKPSGSRAAPSLVPTRGPRMRGGASATDAASGLRPAISSQRMASDVTQLRDRVQERRRAAALARHYHDQGRSSIAEIAGRLGRADATVKAYLYGPRHANKRPTNSPHALTPASARQNSRRHGLAAQPYARSGRRSTVRRGAIGARTSRGTAAPLRYGTPRPTAPAPVGWCLQRPRTPGPSRRYEARASRAPAGGVGSAHSTRRLLVELNNAAVGVSSSAASTGSSFRGQQRQRLRHRGGYVTPGAVVRDP